MSIRTLEQRLKFDFGLTIGDHLVVLQSPFDSHKAIVGIGPKGGVYLTPAPTPQDGWVKRYRVRGDSLDSKGQPWWLKTKTEGWFDGDAEAVVEV